MVSSRKSSPLKLTNIGQSILIIHNTHKKTYIPLLCILIYYVVLSNVVVVGVPPSLEGPTTKM